MTTEANAPAPAPAAPAPAPAAPAPAPAPLDLNAGAPAPAPAASATPPAPAAPAPAPAAAEPITYNPTGDAGLDMVLKFVGEQGYAPDHPAMVAAVAGDFSMLKADLAAKGVKGAEAYMELGANSFKALQAKQEAKKAEDVARVEGVMGGKEEWTKVRAWAIANATDDERRDIGTELQAGGFRALAAATYLRTAFDKANPPAMTEGPGKPVAEARGNATSNAALNPSEYASAVASARLAHKGHGFEESPAYKALQARRMAYRA